MDMIILGGEPAEAARLLNYSNPKQAAVELLRHPQVRKALVAGAEARLEGRSLPMALDTVEEILADKSAPKAVRAKLALGIIDRVRPKADKAPDAGKPVGDMSQRELEQLVAQLQASGVRPGQMLDITPERKGDDDTTS